MNAVVSELGMHINVCCLYVTDLSLPRFRAYPLRIFIVPTMQ